MCNLRKSFLFYAELTLSEFLASRSKATTRPTLNWVTSLQKSVTVDGRGSWVRKS